MTEERRASVEAEVRQMRPADYISPKGELSIAYLSGLPAGHVTYEPSPSPSPSP